MGKKKYTTEITDVFGTKLEAKQALKLAKDIKTSQKKAFPSSEFKKKLFSRLEAVYIVDNQQDLAPRFSIFQLFGFCASFIFIAGGIFSIYSMQEMPQSHPIQFQKMQEPSSDMMQMQIMESEVLETEMFDMPIGDDINSRSSMNMTGIAQEQDISEMCSEYHGVYDPIEGVCNLGNNLVCGAENTQDLQNCIENQENISEKE